MQSCHRRSEGDASTRRRSDYRRARLRMGEATPAQVAKLVDAADLKSAGLDRPCRFDSGPGHQRKTRHIACSANAGMTDDAPQLAQEKDRDLVRWARELGVTYDELVSTLDYAGPTFKDA